jgi:glycosyltransferase involved in cell wall biosynthesis
VGDAALLIDPYRPDDIVAALEAILDSREYTETLRQKGFLQAASFLWPTTARLTKEVFEKIAKV